MGYRKVGGRRIKRGSGQEADLDFENEIGDAETGPSEPAPDDVANDGTGKAKPAAADDETVRSELYAPFAPAHTEAPTQTTLWTHCIYFESSNRW